MRAYAFLTAGRITFVTGLHWPESGWVEPAGDAIRACAADDLTWWLDEQLWEVELDGDVRSLGRALTASRARLVRCVDGWTAESADELVAACAHRTRDHAVGELRAAGHSADAAALEQATERGEIEEVGNRLAATGSDKGRLPGLAADVVLYARDANDAHRAASVAAYIAAFAVAGGDKQEPGYEERFDAERRRQAIWLTERLELDPTEREPASTP